jgi:myo-inositol 2-dehydrogenase/D-chiro-inositol 1-dehydrogenase
MPTSLNGKLKLGIIGCGWATGNLHLPALRRIPGYAVVALADRDLQRAQELGGRFDIRRCCADASEVIADAEVDAVAVCVPPADHADLAIAAINAGKHVFIEKPMTLSIEQADRLVERAAGTDRKVLVGFNLRWHRLVLQAKSMLDEGRFGSISLMRTVFTNALRHDDRIPAWRRDRSLGGGVIQDLAVHHFDLWRFLLSADVQQISVSGRSERWQDEAAVLSARMANGILVSSVFASGTSETHELECYGEAGRLQVSCYRYDGLQQSPERAGLAGLIRGAYGKAVAWPYAVSRMRCGGEIAGSYDAQWRHFLHCMRTGTRVGCTVEDGRRAVQLAVAATESLLTGQPITVKT